MPLLDVPIAGLTLLLLALIALSAFFSGTGSLVMYC